MTLIKRTIITALALIILPVISSNANALPARASHYVYLDASGNVIGERMTGCNAGQVQAGTLSSPYGIGMSIACMNVSIDCGPVKTPFGATFINCEAISSAGEDFKISLSNELRNSGITKSQVCLAYFNQDCGFPIFSDWAGTPFGVYP